MFHGRPGACQAPTPGENSPSKAQVSVVSNDGLKEDRYLHQCRQNCLDSLQSPSEDGNQCSALNSVHNCLSLRGRCLSPHKKVSKIKLLSSNSYRSRCLDFHGMGRGPFAALSFSYRKSPKKLCSQNKRSDGGVAWMTLDGLLVNADDTISSGMVNVSGHTETVVWDGFSPLQKVLLVAVTAAAASAAKLRHTKEMRRLQHAIDLRDKDAEILRGKIRQLQEHLSFWKEQAQNIGDDTKDIGATRKVMLNDNASPLFKLGMESTPRCDSMILEQFATPQIGQGVGNMPEHIACLRRNFRAASFKNNNIPGGCLSKESSNISIADEDNNKKRTFLDRLSESPRPNEGQVQSEASTPQLPFTQLNGIFTPHLPFDDRLSKQNRRLSRYCQKGCREVSVTDDSLTSHVPCAVLILQLKNIMRQLINNEVPDAMAALDSVKGKVQMLDSDESRQSNVFPSCQAIRDLKESIDQAIAKTILLQEAIVSMGNVLVEDPESNVSFSPQDACFGALVKNKEHLLESQGMNHQNLCRQTDAEDNRITEGADRFLTTTVDVNCRKIQESDETSIDSAIQLAVKSTLDMLTAPLSERHQFDDSNWSFEMVIEQLLGELENAAAKVASMEAQIKTLRDSQRCNQSRKEEVIGNLAEIHLNLDMVSQQKQLQSEDSDCQDFTLSEQSGSHTCKELETTLELLKDAEKRIAACRESCKKKEKAIELLEDKIAALQGMVSSFQETPDVVGLQDQPSVQTFVTSNLLFNLDSPVKIDSPQSTKSSFSSWKGLDELSRVSDSLEKASMSGSCDSEMYGLEHIPTSLTEGYKDDEPGCITSVLQVERIYHKHATRRESAEESRRNQCSEDKVRRNSSNTDDLIRKSSSSSSSLDGSGSGPLRHGRLPQPPKSNSSHARKLRFTNAADFRFPEVNDRRMLLSAEAARRDDGSLSRKASNVLAGVEPNTPMRDRKFSGSGKDKFLSQSLDGLNKAKENFAHKKRWM